MGNEDPAKDLSSQNVVASGFIAITQCQQPPGDGLTGSKV